jgi:hypothetical protein
MQKILIMFILLTIIPCVSSCSSFIYSDLQATPTTPATLQHTVNDVCEQTIIEFLQANPCKNWDDFHNLFATDSRHFQATPMASDDPFCGLKASTDVLRIISADEWWKSENPDKPLPEAAKPTRPDELVFFVEYNTQWQPGVVPASQNPGQMLMWMVFDYSNRTCLIRNFGW